MTEAERIADLGEGATMLPPDIGQSVSALAQL